MTTQPEVVAPPAPFALESAPVESWKDSDHDGHGTEMAGLALCGDLGPVLSGRHPVRLTPVLESVKILPPPTAPANRPELYGAVTAEAASRIEVQAPEWRRAFSTAVAATDERDKGQPTSWSAAVDALAAAAVRGIRPEAPVLRNPLIVIAGSGIVISDSDDRDHPVGAKRR